MSDVRVTIGANSAAVESEFAKVQASAGRLKKSVGDAGGVLEGDRRVENKMTAWVDGFKNARNGADLLANTMGNLGDVFRTSLAIGVGLNVGASLVGMIASVIAKSDELHKSAKASGEELRNAFASGDSGKLESSIKKANEELEKLAKKSSGIFTGSSASDTTKLLKDKLDAGEAYLQIARDELEIQQLIANGQDEEADRLTEKLRLKKEIAAIDELKLTPTQRNEAVSLALDASEERLEKKRDERREANEKKDEAASKAAEAAKQKEIDAEQEAMAQFREHEASEEEKARANREKSEKASAESIASFHVQKEKEKWQAIIDAATDARKKIDDADKEALEKKQADLKAAEGVVKQGAQEQKQRDDAKVQGILAGESLVIQRANAKVKDAAYDKAAGIAARDEVRRKVDGDATKMEASKDEINAVKKRMLGEKPMSEKEIADAARAIPKIQEDIKKLVAKLGVK